MLRCDNTFDHVYTLSIQYHYSQHHPNTILLVNHKCHHYFVCVCVCPLMTDTDGLGCFACPEVENTFAEGLSLVILRCDLLTGH